MRSSWAARMVRAPTASSAAKPQADALDVERLRKRLAAADLVVDAAAEFRHQPRHHYLTEVTNRALGLRAAIADAERTGEGT